MRIRPISPPLLVEEIADRIAAADPASRPRVAVDGAPAARPDDLADALAGPLRLRGREVVRVSAGDFLRPASLRLEHGHTDPDVFYDEWLDAGGLVREVLGPLGPGGSGRVLPALWDSTADRAARTPYVTLPPGGVLLLDGTLLLGRGLPFDLSVHLWLSPPALARKTAAEERWTLPAYARYEEERVADLVVRVDHPDRPALVE
ncbi:uridine kinase [Actinomadura sp. DC4]|uniref:uridine kinase n=1 Tax=Actinomadura sp. DC4 TaxID=3055069 RepID=UPI0025B148D2|nr:uridine kinase [Actinomadura sp. DC4]MDN3351555.1 uridine kinase [Actinomadura sp. DC4]